MKKRCSSARRQTSSDRCIQFLLTLRDPRAVNVEDEQIHRDALNEMPFGLSRSRS
jgi:hypothetical protein